MHKNNSAEAGEASGDVAETEVEWTNTSQFTESQLYQLQNQIVSLQALSRGEVLSEHQLHATGALKEAQWSNEKARIFNELKTVRFGLNQIVQSRKKYYPTAVGTVKGSNSALSDKRRELTIESACEGLVSQESLQIEARIKQIENHLASGLFSTATMSNFSVELKLLKSMPVYRKVANNIVGGLWDKLQGSHGRQYDHQYLERSLYIRPKPAPVQPPELPHALPEQAQSFVSEYSRKPAQRRKEFLTKLFEYCVDFTDYHKWRNRTGRRRMANVKLKLEWQGKVVPLDAEQEKNRRLEALNQKNFKDYTNMLERAKEGRIIRILEETDNFLKQLASKVLEIKRKSNPNFVIDEEVSEWLAKKEETYDVSKSTLMSENYTKFYYNLTHTEEESVTQQPSLLEGGTLKKYQQTGLQWMVSLYNNKLNGILADEMGLGKTIQTISLLTYIIEFKQNSGPFLIVVPLTTLSNWMMEFNKWAPQVKKIVFKGNPIQRKQLSHLLKNTKWNVCLTTYEYVLKDKSDLNRFHWQYIIIDEGHKMKNPKSKFAQTLGQLYNSEYRLLLTGTPLQNNLPELWSLLNFLLPQVFHSCDDFEKWFKMPLKRVASASEKDTELSEEDRMLLVHRFHQVLRPFLLRRLKKEVEHELPNKVEFIIKVELSAWQKLIYEQIDRRQCLAMDPRMNKNGKKVLMNMMMQKRKVCNHPYLFLENGFPLNDDIVRASGKFEMLDRILPKLIKAKHRTLIFSQMTKLLDIFEVYFEHRQIKYLRLDGTTKTEDRVDRIAMFNSPESDYYVFVLSTRAGGLGLNLQTADTVIFVDSDWNPQMDRQAQDRAHRIGQKREVRVFRLVTNTETEENILSKAFLKKNLDDIVIQAGLFNQNSTDVERKNQIEEIFKKQDAGGEEEDENDVPTDRDINQMLARDEQEMELYNQIDVERYHHDQGRYNESLVLEIPHYRLMKPEEVPDWVLTPIEDPTKKPAELGKRRVKSQSANGITSNNYINFEKALDEDEFMEVFGDDDDDEEAQPQPVVQKHSEAVIPLEEVVTVTTKDLKTFRPTEEHMNGIAEVSPHPNLPETRQTRHRSSVLPQVVAKETPKAVIEDTSAPRTRSGVRTHPPVSNGHIAPTSADGIAYKQSHLDAKYPNPYEQKHKEWKNITAPPPSTSPYPTRSSQRKGPSMPSQPAKPTSQPSTVTAEPRSTSKPESENGVPPPGLLTRAKLKQLAPPAPSTPKDNHIRVLPGERLYPLKIKLEVPLPRPGTVPHSAKANGVQTAEDLDDEEEDEENEENSDSEFEADDPDDEEY